MVYCISVILPIFIRLTLVQYWNSGVIFNRSFMNHFQKLQYKKTKCEYGQVFCLWSLSLSEGSLPLSHITAPTREAATAFQHSVFRKLLCDENIFSCWVTVASTNNCLSGVVRHADLSLSITKETYSNPNSNTIGACHLLQAKSIFLPKSALGHFAV